MAEREESKRVDLIAGGTETDWLALDCESLGRFVRESAHRAVVTHLHDRAVEAAPVCEVIQ